ncbi:uncharacterized protein LTHEOB_11160 [Lasiodiplodia theobromae]|uniref:uncharacterized protein n=1 Tax=Lasiodiplodia theobromae TaxID=45133 RepID=UPI0015C33B6A|nr:uncharacterized protein LTHEOB_11160 [Lasiodiplodia theobromae]KAF4538035.1 hypothetical protein LTHEOB_11160 [Lasiodiplodia theobromae]
MANDDHIRSTLEQDLLRRMDQCQRSIDASTHTVARLEKSIQHLGGHMEKANTLQILGVSGPSGFAERVYDLIRMKADETRGTNDKYFVYHPDNFWYAAFHSLVERNGGGGGLPESFCMKSDSLDALCLHMQSLRSMLPGGDNATFHILIPAWDNICISEPLCFPDELFPLSIEGTTYSGWPFVTMNVPRAPRGLLRSVSNKVQPEWLNPFAKVLSSAAFGAGMMGVGWASLWAAHSYFPDVTYAPYAISCVAGVASFSPLRYLTAGLENHVRVTPPRLVGSDKRLELKEINRRT